ncbi:hypothetical protein ACX80D_13945 [Arthrobacter sp. Sr24]
MSKETEPIRSRRQLREQSAHTTGAPGVPAVPVSSAPVSPAPAAPAQTPQDSEALPLTAPPLTAPQRERDSQIRARDRAALRAYKGLIDPPEPSPLPSRKALRQAQLEAERAPITAVNPVVSLTATAKKSAAGPETVQGPAVVLPKVASSDTPAGSPASDPIQGAASEVPMIAPTPAVTPTSATVPRLRTRPGRRAAPVPADKYVGGTAPVDAEGTAVPGTAESSAAPAAPRKLPNPPASKPGNAPRIAGETQVATGAGTGSATVAGAVEGVAEIAAPENAAALGAVPDGGVVDSDARVTPLPELVPGGSYYPVTAGPPVAPGPEQLAALAVKRADAERAAILAQRAQARERLAQENVKNRRPPADPTATNNLAMVTPMEFIDVPGSERPMMRPPTTTHVPIVTRSTPRQSPATPAPASTPTSASAKASPVPNINAERFDAAVAARASHRPGPGKRPLTGGRSSTLKRAEAMAAVEQVAPAAFPTAQPERAVVEPASAIAEPEQAVLEPVPVQRSQMPPMPADYAHGMEPLDAMTAGLRRTQRNLLIQWGSIILGGAAFVAGAIMVLTNILN